ncbi:serine-rich 25 kDa antigen protein-like [Cimex lectularius]|uniref:Uncharacterized protein n=1 Tax=Cimex lectularius TaxID=79782 RepID=A0A8I6RJ30_CIMLE|nr:serine-rich 25 kDa antigen protein-like [Cimex lectularius]
MNKDGSFYTRLLLSLFLIINIGIAECNSQSGKSDGAVKMCNKLSFDGTPVDRPCEIEPAHESEKTSKEEIIKPNVNMTVTSNNGTVTEKPGNSSVTEKPKNSTVTAEPNSTVTTKPNSAVTDKPKNSTVTAKPNNAVTDKPKNNTAAAKPNNSTATDKPSNGTVTAKPNNTVTEKPMSSSTSLPTATSTAKPAEYVTPIPHTQDRHRLTTEDASNGLQPQKAEMALPGNSKFGTTSSAALAAGICVSIALTGYISLMVWRRVMIRRYGNSEMLLNEDDVADIQDEDMKHFEAACIQIEV